MALQIAGEGGDVAAWDRDERGLEALLAEAAARDLPGAVCAQVVDLSSRAGIDAAVGRVLEAHPRVAAAGAAGGSGGVALAGFAAGWPGRVDALVNNAGVVSGKPFLECPDRQVDLTMAVNALAPIWLTKRLLPGMPPRAGAFARQWLEGRGVEIWLGTRAEVADRPAAPSGRRQRRECLTLASSGGGLRFEADLLYDCTGNRFSSKSLPRQLAPDPAGGAALEAGQIRVDAALQVEGLEGVFACGDICQSRAWQTAFQAELTGEAAGRNALRALSGRPPRAFPAAASPTVIAVSLHRRSGILQFNRLILTGLLAAGMKALVEACVLGSVSGSRLAGWAMVLMERIAFLLGRVVPPPRKES